MKKLKFILLLAAFALSIPTVLDITSCNMPSSAVAFERKELDSLKAYIVQQGEPTAQYVTKDSFIYQKVIRYEPKLIKIYKHDTITSVVVDSFWLDDGYSIIETIDSALTEKGTKIINTIVSQGKVFSIQSEVIEKPCVPIVRIETKIVEVPRCGFFRRILGKCNKNDIDSRK